MKEEAIKFADWINRNAYCKIAADYAYGWEINDGEWLYSQDGIGKFTTEQLYEIFKKEQNQ